MSSVAVAEDLDEKAKASFARGNTLFFAEKYAAAADAFRNAYRIKPSWKIQYNIAQSESAARRYGLALQAFELFLADGGDEIAVERKDAVLAEIRRLRDMVASLDVQGPDEAIVLVDGVERGEIPLEGFIKITAGKRHNVEVVHRDKQILIQKVRLSGGDSITLTAHLEADAPVVAPAPSGEKETVAKEISEKIDKSIMDGNNVSVNEGVDDASKTDGANNSEKKLRVTGGLLLAVGGALAAGGGVMGGLSLAKVSEVEKLCDSSSNACTSPEATQAYDDARGYGVAANIFISIGAATAVTGLILYLAGKSRKERLVKALQVKPVVANRFRGVSLRGRF